MLADNNEFKNEKEETIKKDKLCEICQNKKAEYECQECPTFKKYCQKCDLYIHSMENKINHIRYNISTKKSKTNSYNDNNDNTDNTKKLNNNPKKETNQVTNNYLNQIKRIYDIDK